MVIIKFGIMYYRNIYDLISSEGIEVEAGSLWRNSPNGKKLFLVDEDQFASTALDESNFKNAGI